MRAYILLSILLVIFLVSPCYGLEIEFRPHSKVTNHSITLGDIAQFSDNNNLTTSLRTQIIGQAPPPGNEYFLNTYEVKRSLTSKLNLPSSIQWKGPSQITVQREGMEVVSSDLLYYINSYLAQHTRDLVDTKISFIPKRLPLPFLLPKGELEVEVLPSSKTLLRSSSFSLIFKVDGRVRKNLSLSGKVQALAPVAVAATTIRKGAHLSPSSIQMRQLDISKLRKPARIPADIIGKRAKRTIKAGAPIELTHIEFPPVIKKGELVKIILQHGALQLTATGIAKMNGARNQIIRVMNFSSKKTIYCRVSAPGLVEVTL